MKIFEVEITNYRQYKGENRIKLSTDPQKNITIIQGNNGEGKSNFMNAVTWCLYGDELFKSKTNIGRSIINESAVYELDEGESVYVSVSVTIGDERPEFWFERKVKYFLNRNKPHSEPETFVGREISTDKGWDNLPNPDWVIDRRFIPKDLRGFFFFDGEKMDRYFEDTSKIKSNVEKIAQIDVLEGVISTLNSLSNQFGSEMKKLSKKSDEMPQDPENNQKILYEADIEKKRIESKITENDIKIEQIDRYLKENSSAVVNELANSRRVFETDQKLIISRIREEEKLQKELISKSISIVYSFFALNHSKEKIEEGTRKGVLPPNIKDVFVRELLEKSVCICGRNIDEDPQCRKNIEALLSQIVPNEVASDSITGRYVIEELLADVNFTTKFRERRRILNDLEKDFDTVNIELQTISSKLSAFDEDEIKEKEIERNQLIRETNQLRVRKGTVGNKIVNATNALNEYNEAIDKIESSDKKFESLKRLRNYTKDIEEAMLEIKDSIVDDMRQQLEDKTREYFFNLIWKRESFSNVFIIDEGHRYRISVMSEHNQECLGDISAGERQILALSFTAALYSVSGYSVPVFIDTPLGRISEEPRENVAKYLPNYLSETQLIMLPTDTEYTESVRSKLKRAVGKEYIIKHDDINKTSKVVNYE